MEKFWAGCRIKLLFFYAGVVKDLFDSSVQYVLKVGRVEVRGEIAHQQRDDCSPVQSVFLFWKLAAVGGEAAQGCAICLALSYWRRREGPTATREEGLHWVMWSHVLFIFIFPVIAQPGKHGWLLTQQLFHLPSSCWLNPDILNCMVNSVRSILPLPAVHDCTDMIIPYFFPDTFPAFL